MLIAGLLHASWHAIVKVGTSLSILAGMGLVSTAVTLPFLFYVPIPTGKVWLILLFSIALHAGYKINLARAYSSAEFSRAYPLARGLIPIFTVPLSYLWLGQLPTVAQLVGIFIIVCGVVGLFIERSFRPVQVQFLLAALGASLMVASYSVVDAWGTRISAGWASFTAWLIVIDSVSFLAIARVAQGPTLWDEIFHAKTPIIIAGLLGAIAFAVFIWALSQNPVANVTAFRECSVLFGTLIGVSLLRESFSRTKLFCALLIVGGLVIVATLK
jgi:drug/metabolite transporter (DMT)-like permease